MINNQSVSWLRFCVIRKEQWQSKHIHKCKNVPANISNIHSILLEFLSKLKQIETLQQIMKKLYITYNVWVKNWTPSLTKCNIANMGVSKNRGGPPKIHQIIRFDRVPLFSPSILGYHYLWVDTHIRIYNHRFEHGSRLHFLLATSCSGPPRAPTCLGTMVPAGFLQKLCELNRAKR